MLLLWMALGANAGAMRAIVEVGPDGPEVVELWPTTAKPDPVPAGRLAVVDVEGRILATAGVPDPRIRSVITPGGGQVAQLERGRIDVVLDWPEGAVGMLRGDRLVRPQQPRSATGGAVQLVGSGSSDERLDLVFVSEGYTADELGQFADDVDWIVDYLLQIEPYASYQSMINIWRVDVPSAESGAGHPSTSTAPDTALGCAYECRDISQLICCDETSVLDAVHGAVPDAEGVVVLVNDAEYGGSGGFDFAVAYNGRTDGHQVAVHELGHSLVWLWDEYSFGYPGDLGLEAPNCSNDVEGHWPEWVGTDGVDAFQDCTYTSHFRPTATGCMMRTLTDGYCPVCRQEVVRAMYQKIPRMTTGTSPAPGPVEGGATITVGTLLPPERLEILWQIDGERVGSGPSFTVPDEGLTGDLGLTVHDPTAFVRADPEDLLSDYLGPWTAPDATEGEAPRGCGCATGPTPAGLWWLPLLFLARRSD